MSFSDIGRIKEEMQPDRPPITQDEEDDALMAEFDDDQQQPPPSQDQVSRHDDKEDDDRVVHSTLTVAPQRQAPFPPAATPLDSRTRILCWNHLGVVTHRYDDDDQFAVHVDYTDITTRRNTPNSDTFAEGFEFCVGTLGEDGALLASATGDVYFRRGRRQSRDWHLRLDGDEYCVGAATGAGWAAVATSRRYLRTFTTGGAQHHVTWLPCDAVTMCGRGRWCTVFYLVADPIRESAQQCLGYVLLDMSSFTTVSTGRYAPGSLTWAGVGEDGVTYAMDQEGVLSALHGTSGHWCPVLDTSAVGKNNKHYWPVTIAGARLLCVPLAPHESYPNPTRRPTTTSLPLKIPLANLGAGQATALKLEEVYLRSDLALQQKRLVHQDDHNEDDFAADYERYRTNVDKVTLKLFFEAVRANHTDMALDLVGRLHKEKSYDVALKAADRMNRVQLSEEIEKARDQTFGVIMEEETKLFITFSFFKHVADFLFFVSAIFQNGIQGFFVLLPSDNFWQTSHLLSYVSPTLLHVSLRLRHFDILFYLLSFCVRFVSA